MQVVTTNAYLRIFKAKHVENANKTICSVLDRIVKNTHGFGRLGARRAHRGCMLGCHLPLVVDTFIAETKHFNYHVAINIDINDIFTFSRSLSLSVVIFCLGRLTCLKKGCLR